MCENPARIAPGGRCCRCRSVAVGPASARPDQAEGLAAFVIEEVGVDRRGEARIVELDRKVIAALAGALRPRGTDLCAADKHPVAWRVVAGSIGLRNDADAFGLDAKGDDLALELLVAGLLEGTDGCHVVFSLAVRARDHRGLDGDRQAAGDRRRTPRGRSAAEDGGGETPAFAGACFLGSRGMGAAQGKKVSPPPLRQGDRGLPSCGPISPSRGRAGRVPDSLQGEDAANMGPCKRPGFAGGGTETLAYGKAAQPSRDQAQRSLCRHWGLSAADSGAGQSKRLRGPRCSRSDLTIGIRRSPNRRHDEARPQLSLAADAAGHGDLTPASSPAPVSGGTASARRAQAVAPTATAPKSANARCHSSAGTPSWARPRAA